MHPIPRRLSFRRIHPRRALAAALLALMAVLGIPSEARAERLPVVLDGFFDDWGTAAPAWTDPSGDAGGSGIDLGRLWLADDPRYIYLRFEVGPELLLNDRNNINLALDTDNNAATGQSVNGIGADLVWRPGQKSGTFYYGATQVTVQWDDCGFVGMPTVSGLAFEVAFRRDARPDGTHPLFPGGAGATIRVLLRDTGTGGDLLPNTGQTLSYELDQGAPITETPIPLARRLSTDLRVVTWNVLSDGPWNGTLQPKFKRQIQAVIPDIISFQEIYNHTPEVTRTLVASWLPGTWYAAGNNDCITVSRYPVLGSWPLDGNLAVYLDTEAAIGKRTLVINVHLYCCTNDTGRQQEIDRILSFIRDALTPGGSLDLPRGAAILFMGDTNLVGASGTRTSLLTGNISDNATFGPDFAPDWDGGSLTDLISRQTEKRLCYTWLSATGAFWPGRLDYLVYNDSAVSPANHFVLDPSGMSADSLAAHRLQAADAAASDHLLHCVDLRVASPNGDCPGGSCPGGLGPDDRLRCSMAPNPSRGTARLALAVRRTATLRLTVFNAAGRRVADPFGGEQEYQPGNWTLQWDGRGADGRPLPPAIYFVRLDGSDTAGAVRQTVRWVVIR
jgi:endonuclease/exonuclease/phosphatase family metal-dependent hydrolase